MERRLVSLNQVRILVLDEADRMLDMGFKPQVDRIVKQLNHNRQTMFFSATLTGEVGMLARDYTSNAVRFEGQLPVEHAQGKIEHRFVSVALETKTEKLLEILNEERELALIFCRTKRGADRLAERLMKRGVKAQALHGDMGQAQRERALKQFEQGEVTVLVATDVAARGLDVDGITHVINYDPPEEHATYTHRVGRTGRAGRSGIGITLVLPDEQAETGRVARMNGQGDKFAETGMKAARPKLVYNGSRRGRGGRSKW
jgi:ATP-dependent RNA helicase DeaD/ATP-dependent RNA helicase RhlE